MDNTVGNEIQVFEEFKVHIFDEEIGDILWKRVEQLGHKVVVSQCQKEALQKITETNFDLILLDANRSNGNGINLIQEIRKLAGDVHIIAMAGDPSRELEQKLREQRIIYYMIKPFEFVELKSIINHLSERKIKFMS